MFFGLDRVIDEKEREEIKNHFLQRLEERYGITGVDYEEILKLKKEGVYRKGRKTIMKMEINGILVWGLWSTRSDLLTSVFPKTFNEDPQQTIMACFPRSLRSLAFFLYRAIEEEIKSAKYDFETRKEAAIYYQTNHTFPKILMRKYLNLDLAPMRICHEIRKVINDDHPLLKLAIIKRNTKEKLRYDKSTNESGDQESA